MNDSAKQERLRLIAEAARRASGEAVDPKPLLPKGPPPHRHHAFPPIVLSRSDPLERHRALPNFQSWPYRT